MHADKKALAAEIRMVLPVTLGAAVMEGGISFESLQGAWERSRCL